MNKKLPISFKPLFWDFSLDTIDIQRNSKFIVERVLEKGDWDSVQWIFQNFSRSFVQSVIESSYNLSSRTKNFWFIVLV